MSRTITAMFDNRTQADAAVVQLMQDLNIERAATQVYAADVAASPAAAGTSATSDDRGFWGSMKDFFVPEADRMAFAEGVRRGGIVVSAKVDNDALDEAMDILEANGAVDLDTREAQWKQAGWTGGASNSEAATTMARAGDEEVIPIVEETLQVGKRDVERGRVRVRSFVVETPVSEQVTLRNETVDIQRRMVDRPLTDADEAFRERTIEATETAEEAVVAKQARVTGEVVIRKDATERTETVKDTVRRTEVEVDDTTETSRAPGDAGLADIDGINPTNVGSARPAQSDGMPGNPPGTVASRAVDDALGTNVSGARPTQSDGTSSNPSGTMASRAVDKTLGTDVSGDNPARKG